MALKRRMIALLLAVLCAAFPFSQYVGAERDQAAEAQEAYQLLTSCGLLNAEETPFESGSEVSRAKLVRWVINLSGNADAAAVEDQKIFMDVPQNSADAAVIAAAYRLGYINGDPEGNFNPQGIITGMQALKIALSAIGYGTLAQQSGGYPAGYMNAALSAKLTSAEGILSESPLTFESAMILLRDMVEADLMKPETYGTSVKMTQRSGVNLLSDRYSIYSVKGILDGDRYTTLLSAESGLSQGDVSIDDVTYQEGSSGASALLGRFVKAYYHAKDLSSEERTILYLSANQAKNTVTEIDSKDVQGLSGTKLSFAENGASVHKELSKYVVLIDNGKMGTLSSDKLMAETGKITLISNDGDDTVDVILLMRYDTYVVSGASSFSYLVSAKDGTKITLDPTTSDYDCVFEKNGKPAAFSDIQVSTVLSVAESSGAGKNRKLVRISSASIQGLVSEVGDDFITLNQTDYPATDALLQSVKVGLEGKFLLDTFGTVVSYDGQKDIVYGYLRGLDSGSLGRVSCRIFTENARWVTLDFKDKVRLNGDLVPAAVAAQKLAGEGGDYHQMVRYLVNEDRKLTAIDTAAVFEAGSNAEKEAIQDNTFRLSYSGTKSFRSGPKSFDGLVFVDPSAKIFVIPDAAKLDEEQKYGMVTISSLVGDQSYTVKAYDADEMTNSSVLMIQSFQKNISSGNRFLIVKSKGSILDMDQNPVDSLRGYWSGSEIAFPVDLSSSSEVSSLSALQPGDIIQFTYNEKGSIDTITRYAKDTAYSIKNSVYASFTVIQGVVKKSNTSQNQMLLQYTQGGSIAGMVINSSTLVSIYDITNDYYRGGDISDLLEGDAVIASFNYMTCKEIIVLRK